ncbi:hypothetical protein GCM10009577_79130 [Streptomyces javensis]
MAGNHQADAADDLPHPDPLNRGALRRGGGIKREHPADGPALTHASLTPRRGAVCLVQGTGTLCHVDHLDSLKRVVGRLRDYHHRSPTARPLDLLKVVGAILFLINVGDTILPRRDV